MPKLFMLLIGCKPAGRHTEQHDVYFGIGETIKDLIPGVIEFWPEAKGKLHFDAWREISQVNGYTVSIVPAGEKEINIPAKLFFINLGGYKQNEFEEFHYKMIIAADNKSEAINLSKKTAFFRHTGFKGADSHIDDKYGIDVDDIFEIKDILPEEIKQQYRVAAIPNENLLPEDEIHLGYFKLNSFQ
jgi:hypothetical protein